MKVDQLLLSLFLTTTLPCSHIQFANAFLQGAPTITNVHVNVHANTNTAFIGHNYNGRHTLTLTPSALSIATGSRSSRGNTQTRLYGFMDRFNNESNDNEDNNDNDNDNDNEDETSMDYSTAELENARKAFEEIFSIPNDNLDTQERNKNKSSSSYTSSSSSSSSSSSLSPTEEEILNNIDNDNDADSDTNNNTKDKEKQRDLLMTKTKDITKIANAIPQSPLTAIGRERRHKEIKLLSTLTESDDAVNDLWALWIAEKGPAAATLLLRAEQLMSIESYDEAESILWSLIHQYGVHWAEPLNRLATLKYMQGSLQESRKLCEVVLQVKPWHFGALSGIVLVCTALSDATGARLWADRRLPPLIPDHTSGDRRVKWITQALEAATDSLTVASKVGRSSKLGKEETEFRTFRARMQHLDLDSNSNDNSSSSSSTSPSSNNPDAWQ